MKAAIVTGVSRGLGEALAVAMIERGFTVLGVGRTASPRLTSKPSISRPATFRSPRCWPPLSRRRCASSRRASRPR
jgi:nucleoside-diphosphate-sugar epimerase